MPAGRPKFKITKAVCKKAKKLASRGLTQKQIASVLGMGETTFYEKLKEYPEFLKAVDDGRAEGIKQVSNALFKNCIKGDTGAQKYYLNNRDNHNWKDRVENTHQGPDGGPIPISGVEVTFVDPKPESS